MHRFLAKGPFIVGSVVDLDPEQSHHAARVLRLEPGEGVGLLDGVGSFAQAVLTEVHAKHSRARVESVRQAPAPWTVTLAFGIPKGQALDVLIRRTTELGLLAFQPLQSQHSATLKGWNAERWSGVVAEVCKQCQELRFPRVEPPALLSQWLKQRDKQRLLIVCDEAQRMSAAPATGARGIDLLVGAEGGFAPEEREALQREGALFLGLGRNRLRAETAAIVALALVKKQFGEI